MNESHPELNSKLDSAPGAMSRTRFLQSVGLMAAGGAMLGLASCKPTPSEQHPTASTTTASAPMAQGPLPKPQRVSADPTKIPAPIRRSNPITHQVSLEVREVVAEIKDGVPYRFMTFNGQVPAPLIRVMEGDTIELTLSNPAGNMNPHSVDFHSCYGSGGGAAYTLVGPGQTKKIRFRVNDPGAFIYHCAVTDLDYHISSGMYGMMLVEPKGGLPAVDHEFYFGQNEMYIKDPVDAHSLATFDTDAMIKETAQYVVLNGAFNAITEEHYGALKVKKGETARLFFVNGGPNLISSFHPIGNIWNKAWLQGSLANPPFRFLQTMQVNPGSCAIFEMKFPVPETVKLADHSITRTARQGLLAEIHVEGSPEPDIFQVLPS